MVTLLAACVGGADWIAIIRPIRDISGWLVPFFLVVVVFVIFGLANLLTSLLTDLVLRNSQTQERMIMSEAWGEQKSAINRFRDMLVESGRLQDGHIHRKNVSRAIKSDKG
eukprot:CAMPEP_0172692176 /NCGR_PEP_ID=MMETSP1074-20121228/25060_1 /TAXON_ID=2916 /ORGANISM="Ceratium fusus, Strain PA161109" /LENGTH=110 /DNA_ID=CAMNT_0013512327 /DNA_START=14 /DNA_END=343 /DNA_ORIENTATION=+